MPLQLEGCSRSTHTHGRCDTCNLSAVTFFHMQPNYSQALLSSCQLQHHHIVHAHYYLPWATGCNQLSSRQLLSQDTNFTDTVELQHRYQTACTHMCGKHGACSFMLKLQQAQCQHCKATQPAVWQPLVCTSSKHRVCWCSR